MAGEATVPAHLTPLWSTERPLPDTSQLRGPPQIVVEEPDWVPGGLVPCPFPLPGNSLAPPDQVTPTPWLHAATLGPGSPSPLLDLTTCSSPHLGL